MEDNHESLISKYILVDKKPVKVNLLQWAEWFEDLNNRGLFHDICEKDGVEVRVSTLFMGLDLGDISKREEHPLLFETMVFGGIDNYYMKRYRFYDDALAGHNEILNNIKLGIKNGKSD
jgi:hypothetical protein